MNFWYFKYYFTNTAELIVQISIGYFRSGWVSTTKKLIYSICPSPWNWELYPSFLWFVTTCSRMWESEFWKIKRERKRDWERWIILLFRRSVISCTLEVLVLYLLLLVDWSSHTYTHTEIEVIRRNLTFQKFLALVHFFFL